MIALILGVAFGGYVLLAFLTVLGNWRRLSNILFAIICLCFAFWTLGILQFVSTNDPAVALGYAQMYYVSAALFPALVLLFTLYYPRERKLPSWIVAVVGVSALAMAACMIVEPHWMINSLYHEQGAWRADVNTVNYLIFSVYFVALFATAAVVSVYKFMTYRGIERKRASYYAFGIIATSIPGFIANLILPYSGNYDYVWIGPVASIIVLISTGYSIIRHKMFDIKEFLSRAIVYALLIMTITGLYAGLLFLTSSVLLPSEQYTTTGFVINVIIALIAAFSFQPLKQFFDRLTVRLLLRESYDLQETTGNISAVCVETTDLETLINRVGGIIRAAFGPEYLLVVFNDSAHDTITLGKIPKKLQLPRAALRDELATMNVRPNELREKSGYIAGVYHLKTSSQHLGYLVVGHKRKSRLYSRNDTTLMNLTVDELSIAVQNIFRLEEIRSFAATLESEVDTATRELRASNKKLLELDATKDEFVGMASHQLRTPLTSVKGYISMVLEGDAGKITKQQRQLLQEAFTSSERMVHLISDFLNVSRLQTGRFIVDRKQADLANVVAQEVANIKQIAASHKVRINYKRPARFPLLYLDEGKIHQVIMNFMDNAIYYSPDDTPIKISLTIEDGEAVLRVIDKGMGVPEEAQHKLFTKFFRAENARRQRPDGTGVGLFLAKKVIDGHGGSIVFESMLGKGSTFGFRLPIKKLSEPPAPNEDAIAQ